MNKEEDIGPQIVFKLHMVLKSLQHKWYTLINHIKCIKPYFVKFSLLC